MAKTTTLTTVLAAFVASAPTGAQATLSTGSDSTAAALTRGTVISAAAQRNIQTKTQQLKGGTIKSQQLVWMRECKPTQRPANMYYCGTKTAPQRVR
jgi:hypothetical protein